MTRSLRSLALILALSCAPLVCESFAADIPKTGEVPRDATGRCQDGAWSSSAKKKGACSGHGGVQAWFGNPPKGAVARCKDGTFTKSAGQGACSGHDGVAYKLDQAPKGM